jgi:GNAT superfamily N-acetyltransferase
VRIRDATPADRGRLRELYTAFVHEIPPPPGVPLDLEHELGELEEYLGPEHVALVAEDDDGVVGFALGRMRHPGEGRLSDIYVAPEARRRGIAREFIREVALRLRDEGAVVLTLDVQVGNAAARAAYERLGFELELFGLYAPVETLIERGEEPTGETFGSAHVQLDDERAVEQAVRKYVPRLGRSQGTVIAAPRNGWIGIYDELCSRDPDALRRLATELSNATGAVVLAIGVEEGAVVRYLLFDRGSVVDEYLSVPEFYGPIPPGDVMALGANATVVARLTGADPKRVREVARTAESPRDLPPARDLVAQIGEVLGVAGVDRGWERAGEIEGGVAIEHG